MKIIFTTAFLILSVCGYSQDQSKNSFGLTIGIAQPDYFLRPASIKGRSLDADFRYYRTLSRKMKFETGLGWHRTSFASHSSIPPFARYAEDIRVLYGPLFLRVNFSQYFFIEGGE